MLHEPGSRKASVSSLPASLHHISDCASLLGSAAIGVLGKLTRPGFSGKSYSILTDNSGSVVSPQGDIMVVLIYINPNTIAQINNILCILSLKG